MTASLAQRVKIIKQYEPVRGLEVTVWETEAEPREVSVVILGAGSGWTDVAQIDSTDPGAVARALTLAEVIHDALESAECVWFPDA